jgi:hypothetical protein
MNSNFLKWQKASSPHVERIVKKSRNQIFKGYTLYTGMFIGKETAVFDFDNVFTEEETLQINMETDNYV